MFWVGLEYWFYLKVPKVVLEVLHSWNWRTNTLAKSIKLCMCWQEWQWFSRESGTTLSNERPTNLYLSNSAPRYMHTKEIFLGIYFRFTTSELCNLNQLLTLCVPQKWCFVYKTETISPRIVLWIRWADVCKVLRTFFLALSTLSI